MIDRAFILPRTLPGGIRRSRDIGRVVQELESLPEDKSWRILLEECKSERSLQQNKYLFGVAYKIISKETGYEKKDVHEQCLKEHFGTRLKKVPRCRDYPDGWKEVPVRTTTTDEHGRRSVLGKTAFAEYVEFVKRWAANLNIYVPDPNEEFQTERAA
jgi:hypothetical protein